MLKAAYGIFLREGIRDLNLHKIADKLGVSRHDLHAAVGDKRELAEQSVEYGLQQLDETLKAVEASSANPIEALIRTTVTACDAFGQMSWMFSEDAPYYPAVVDAIELERQKLQEQQHTIFRQGVEQGYLLGEAYYELFEQLFWQNVTAGTRHRDRTGPSGGGTGPRSNGGSRLTTPNEGGAMPCSIQRVSAGREFRRHWSRSIPEHRRIRPSKPADCGSASRPHVPGGR